MPGCPLPHCGREELPTGPGLPPNVRIPCAHVMKNGAPCPSSFGEAYDDEAKALIMSEDVMWDLREDPPGFVRQVNQRPVPVEAPSKRAYFESLPPPKREEPPPPPKRKGKSKTAKPAPVAAEKAPEPAAENGEDEVDSWEP